MSGTQLRRRDPAPRAIGGALREAVERVEREGGVVGIAATRLADGRHIGRREDELFPAASAIKAPILVTLYEEVLAGRADLRERVTYRAATKVTGSGVLKDLDDGLALTLRDLAVLMITVSDNTAADLLLERVTKAGVEAAMDRYGLPSIRIPFSIAELLAELADVDPRSPDAYEETRRRLRFTLGSGGRAVVPETSDRCTPRELCRLFELIESREILEEAACADILEILKRQHADSRIPARLPEGTIVAHKTGTIRGVRNDAGIVYAPNGPYAVALLSRGVRSDHRTDVALAEVSLAIHEELTAK